MNKPPVFNYADYEQLQRDYAALEEHSNKLAQIAKANANLVEKRNTYIEQLQQKHTQAMELLGLAVEDMQHSEIRWVCCTYCQSKNCVECDMNYSLWRWKHADKLEELRGGKANE